MLNAGSHEVVEDMLLKLGKGKNLREYKRSYMRGDQLVASRPVEIFCEVAKCCNISCIMCATYGHGWEGVPIMPLELVEKTKSFFRDALMMHAFGFGEPLMNKDLLNIIGLAKSRGVIVDFFTNAVLLKEDKARALVDMGVDEIVVSFDGGTRETYERVHEKAKFDTVLNNLKTLDKLRKKMGANKPRLAINFIAMNLNFHELPLLVELAAGFGVSSIDVKPLVIYEFMSDMHAERRSYDPEKDDGLISEVNKLAALKNIEVHFDQYYASRNRPGVAGTCQVEEERPEKLKTREDLICFQPWKTFYVRSDGNVKPCCFYWDESFVGNLYENSPEEIWNGPEYRRIRESISKGIYPEGCQHCCEFNNRPKHDNSKYFHGKVIEGEPVSETFDELFEELEAMNKRHDVLCQKNDIIEKRVLSIEDQVGKMRSSLPWRLYSGLVGIIKGRGFRD